MPRKSKKKLEKKIEVLEEGSGRYEVLEEPPIYKETEKVKSELAELNADIVEYATENGVDDTLKKMYARKRELEDWLRIHTKK